uniref:YkgJ family cysteine cluster protein n=1 Tax=Romanomermis culicivorax TaxID=13658 RepID=A0A915J2P5_ROMCU
MATTEQFSDQAATLKSFYGKPALLHCRQCSICCRENQRDEPMTSNSINIDGITCPTYRKIWNDDEAFITVCCSTSPKF